LQTTVKTRSLGDSKYCWPRNKNCLTYHWCLKI